MAKYRKKPVVIEAWQWNGDFIHETDPDWIQKAMETDIVAVRVAPEVHIEIRTLEGKMTGSIGDFIIRGVKGEIYPCKPDIFAATYEAVTE
jgi:hypothetical protein